MSPGQSAQTETLASLDLTPALPCVPSIAVAENPAAPSAVSSTDKMRQPKRPPLRSTRPPSAPTTAATQSAHAKPAPVRSSRTSPEKAQRPEFTGPKTTDPGKNGFPGRLRSTAFTGFQGIQNTRSIRAWPVPYPNSLPATVWRLQP